MACSNYCLLPFQSCGHLLQVFFFFFFFVGGWGTGGRKICYNLHHLLQFGNRTDRKWIYCSICYSCNSISYWPNMPLVHVVIMYGFACWRERDCHTIIHISRQTMYNTSLTFFLLFLLYYYGMGKGGGYNRL